MNCEIVATAEAVLHAHDLAEHLLLALALQMPECGEILPQHPDGLDLAPAHAPRLHMLSLPVVTVYEAEHIALLELRERLRDSIAKLMELGLYEAVQDDAYVEVREGHAVDIVLPYFHLR